MSDFEAAVKKFADQALDRVQKTRNGFVENLFQSVVDQTPVDTGALRANWQAASGHAPTGETGPRGEDAVKSEIVASTASLGQRDGEVLLVNNLPYARTVEYGSTATGRAPAGMVRGALAEAPWLLDQAAGKVK